MTLFTVLEGHAGVGITRNLFDPRVSHHAVLTHGADLHRKVVGRRKVFLRFVVTVTGAALYRLNQIVQIYG